MAEIADRVKETTTTTGTGTITLGGAATGFRTFSSAFSNGDSVYYCIQVAGGADWEVGIGTFSSTTLTRDIVLTSSNSNALVSFSAGSKDVFVTMPARDFFQTMGIEIAMNIRCYLN